MMKDKDEDKDVFHKQPEWEDNISIRSYTSLFSHLTGDISTICQWGLLLSFTVSNQILLCFVGITHHREQKHACTNWCHSWYCDQIISLLRFINIICDVQENLIQLKTGTRKGLHVDQDMWGSKLKLPACSTQFKCMNYSVTVIDTFREASASGLDRRLLPFIASGEVIRL